MSKVTTPHFEDLIRVLRILHAARDWTRFFGKT